MSNTVKKPNPNLQSVVSCINIGKDITILLGADLENSNKVGIGWKGILDSNVLRTSNKSIIFKVPHHGSEDGFDEKIWTRLVKKDFAYLTTTPMVRGANTLLPTIDMIKNICNFTPNFYITSNPYSNKTSKHPRKVQKMFNSLGLISKIPNIAYEFGQVRFRKNLKENNSPITVELFGNAQKINCNSFKS